MSQLKTHRVIFKRRGREPILIARKKAKMLFDARQSPAYNPKMMISFDNEGQCEIGAIDYIEKLSKPATASGVRECTNEKCHKDNRLHHISDPCDYDMTGKCSMCDFPIDERTREYTKYKYKKELCDNCKPYAKRLNALLPGDDQYAQVMRGVATHLLRIGKTEDEATARAMKVAESLKG